VNLARYFPLPFTCLHGAYIAGVTDEHGNTVPGWADPVPVDCVWWSPDSTEPGYQFRASQNAGSDQVSVDLTLVVDSSLVVDHRDRFTVAGHDFEVVGLPKDYDHGPFGFSPNRRPIELKWMG
jgi:hypothetical protein